MAPGDDYGFKHRVFFGTNRTNVWIDGRVYTLMYERFERGVLEPLVKPEQARELDWSNVSNVLVTRVNGRTRNPTLIRVDLTRRCRVTRYGPDAAFVWMTNKFYLRPSTRNKKLQPILLAKMSEQQCIPFLMGTHGRLGDQSLVNGLDAELVRLVCRFL
jgi:hypothetical protein